MMMMMMMMMMKFVLLSTLLAVLITSTYALEATFYDNNEIKVGIIDKTSTHAVAYGTFNDTLLSVGWGVLKIYGNYEKDALLQYYGGGYVEGYLSFERITQQAMNMRSTFFGSIDTPPAQKLLDWLATQDAWVRSQIKSNPSDPYWLQVSYVMAQFDGLMKGVLERCQTQPSSDQCKKMNLFDFQLLQDTGDLLDLMNVINTAPNWLNMSANEFEREFYGRSMCSGLIKVTYNMSELYAAHSSWFTYGSMNRIYKTYSFNVHAISSTKTISFSSYPGFLVSLDDFYVMDSQLTMVQTTNSIYNAELYKLVKPESLFAWQRVRVANKLAQSGREWFQHVEQYNSGTYNNQYMIVDYKLFEKNKPLVPDTLWVVEQIPGLVIGADITRELERGYFPSYNVPYFIEIYNKSGYPSIVAKHGDAYSYQLAPRAQIFRRDQDKVQTLDDLKHIMRYNDYEVDPISKKSPWNAICSRGDLANPPQAAGCYDTKVTSSELSPKLHSYAINGPTTEYLPPFTWTEAFNSTLHEGQPTTFNFDFVLMTPTL